MADGPAWLRLDLPEAQTISEVRLTFDPNLSREIMPSITAMVRNRQCKGMPDELVRDYTIELLRDKKTVYTISIKKGTRTGLV